jgi:hypothetical protein
LFTKAASGSGVEKEIVSAEVIPASVPHESSKPVFAYGSWSPDGKYFTFILGTGPKAHALCAKPLSGGEPFVVVAPASPQSNIGHYRISPNGRWVAYTSDESGRTEVYIAPFPRGDGKWQVSTSGADFAAWRGDGKEIYFDTNADQFMACSIAEKGNELEIGTPQLLFPAYATAIGVEYDVSADGKRFLINLAGDEAPAPLRLMVNWTAELKKK